MSDAIDKLTKFRESILFIELAGLFHDIGKLGEAFLHYRQTWWEDPDGWDNDPHDNDFLSEHENLKNLIPEQFLSHTMALYPSIFNEGDFSIFKAVNKHTEARDDWRIIQMLKAADSNDSAHDRNNPLFSAEQRKQNRIHASNVFGFEAETAIDLDEQEKLRENLYIGLKTSLPTYFSDFKSGDRRLVLKQIRSAFDQGLSDTTRPQNDTTLWEHSYAVASILKVITVHNIFHEEHSEQIYKREDVEFGILGVGWDGLSFISQGQKIGDIVSRKSLMEEIKKKVRIVVESEYPVGNMIYEDDDGIYFIVPREFNQDPYKSIYTKIEDKIRDIALEESDGELQPHLVNFPKTSSLTCIVATIGKMKKKAAFRFDGGSPGFDLFRNKLIQNAPLGLVCPICGLRTHGPDETEKVCDKCLDRRKKSASRKKRDGDNNQTVFIDEIIGQNERQQPCACLIVAQFGLDDWMNGKMIRSLFVSEARGIEEEIESLGEIESFEVEKEREVKKWIQENLKNGGYNFEKIKGDIDAILDFKTADADTRTRAENTAFLYGYGRKGNVPWKSDSLNRLRDSFKKSIKNAKNEISFDDISFPKEGSLGAPGPDLDRVVLYNVVNAKSPTPSTILDVWNTTRKFFEQVVSMDIFNRIFEETFSRLALVTTDPIDNAKQWKGTVEAVLEGDNNRKFEILCTDANTIEIVGESHDKTSLNRYQNSTVRITENGHKADKLEIKVSGVKPGYQFKPYRIITKSPKIFMAIVPGDKALDITKAMHERYLERFGKVLGRLPLNIGNVFFRKRTPMFVVLDSARRMLKNFETLTKDIGPLRFKIQDRLTQEKEIDLVANVGLGDRETCYHRRIEWRLPYLLGDCGSDFYHPYFFVAGKNSAFDGRSTFFPTMHGNAVHFSQIEKNDTLLLSPNYYDFEFIDTNSKRLNLCFAGNSSRRQSTVGPYLSKPVLLDEFDLKIVTLWEMLKMGKGFETLTDSKLRNIQSLWLSRLNTWKVDLGKTDENPQRETWLKLVKATLKKEFKLENNSKKQELVMETIENGLFFDILDLYLSILKQKIGK